MVLRKFLRLLLTCTRRRHRILIILLLLLPLNYVVCLFFHTLSYVKNANDYVINVDISMLTLSPLKISKQNSAEQTQKDNLDKHISSPLLTLFTTFKDIPQRQAINKITIDTWSSLPRIHPVMFTELDQNSPLEDYALKHGWSVFRAPTLRYGYPVLKDMFLYAIYNVTPSTQFVAYANSDIVFTSDLTETVAFLSKLDDQYLTKRGLLVSGRRINTLISEIREKANTHHMSIAQQEVLFDTEDAIDYFITTRDGYPWHKVPDFVIGKPGYDNWLLKKAVDWDLLTIDSSLTVSALHQTYNATHSDKGWLSKDVCINRDLIDIHGYFPYYMGRTACLKYLTNFSSDQHKIDREEIQDVHMAQGNTRISHDTSHHNSINLLLRQARIRYCYLPVTMPFTGVRKFKKCAELAQQKTEKSEKFLLKTNK